MTLLQRYQRKAQYVQALKFDGSPEQVELLGLREELNGAYYSRYERHLYSGSTGMRYWIDTLGYTIKVGDWYVLDPKSNMEHQILTDTEFQAQFITSSHDCSQPA